MFIWIDPQWDARNTAVLERLTKVVEKGREEASDLSKTVKLLTSGLKLLPLS
jgi:hypothetical protein